MSQKLERRDPGLSQEESAPEHASRLITHHSSLITPLRLDAWWLPGLAAGAVTDWRTLTYGERERVELRVPVLSPSQLGDVMDGLAAARDAYLGRAPIGQIVATIDRAVSRWLDPYSRWRRLAERVLPAITGYS